MNQNYEQYSWLAQIVSIEFLEQSQIDIQNLSRSFSEGEILDKTNTEKENIIDISISEGERLTLDRCEIGREKEQELDIENLEKYQ